MDMFMSNLVLFLHTCINRANSIWQLLNVEMLFCCFHVQTIAYSELTMLTATFASVSNSASFSCSDVPLLRFIEGKNRTSA